MTTKRELERCKYSKDGVCTKRPYLGDTNCPDGYDPTITGACRHKSIVHAEWVARVLATITNAEFIAEWKRRCPCSKCVNDSCEECVWCADQCSDKFLAAAKKEAKRRG